MTAGQGGAAPEPWRNADRVWTPEDVESPQDNLAVEASEQRRVRVAWRRPLAEADAERETESERAALLDPAGKPAQQWEVKLLADLLAAQDDVALSRTSSEGIAPEVAQAGLAVALARYQTYTARQGARAAERQARQTLHATWALVLVTVALVLATIALVVAGPG